MSSEKQTQKIVDEMIPTIVGVDRKNAQKELGSFVKELDSITKGKTQPLDFDVLIDTALENSGIEEDYVLAASNNFLIDLDVTDQEGKPVVVKAFEFDYDQGGVPGTHVIVDNKGAILSAYDLNNPAVPEEYGHRHSYPFLKIAESAALRAIYGDVDPTKDAGYKALTDMKRAAGMLGKDSLPHIGHSVVRGKDGEIVLGGTTGRTASTELIEAIKKYRPDLVKRLFVPDGQHSDNLAGLLDTMSGKVASDVLANTINSERSSGVRVVVKLPDPSSPEHQGIDWN